MSEMHPEHAPHATPGPPGHGEHSLPEQLQILEADPDSYPAIPVRVVGVVETSTGADQFGVYTTVVIPGSVGGVPSIVQLLARDPLRQFAYITAIDTPIVLATYVEALQSVNNIAASQAAVFRSTYNTSVGPGSSVSLANFSGGSLLPPGTYSVQAEAYFGTAVAPVDGTDSDNMFLSVDGVSIGGQLMLPALSNFPQTYSWPSVVTTTGAIAIKTKAAATAGVVYRTGLTVSAPAQIPAPIPSGALLAATMTAPAIRHNDPVYAVNTGSGAARVALWVERGPSE